MDEQTYRKKSIELLDAIDEYNLSNEKLEQQISMNNEELIKLEARHRHLHDLYMDGKQVPQRGLDGNIIPKI